MESPGCSQVQIMIQINEFKGVIILYNDTPSLIKGEAVDLISEQGVVTCAQAVDQALSSQDLTTRLIPFSDQAETALTEYSPADWVVFNLAEGSRARLYEEARIAWLLEARGYYFTGCCGRTLALTTNKALTKYYLTKIGLRTPSWWLFHTTSEVVKSNDYPFPLFVKPVAEDASLGIENSSVVYNLKSLQERVDYVIQTYQQAALVEEFIRGREFNIAAWGNPPQLLPLAEIDFQGIDAHDARIVNYAAKWLDASHEYHHTPAICPARVPPKLQRSLARSALRALDCAGVRAYARVDLRLSEENIPYILEINCNPDISPEAGFATAAASTGLTYQEMIAQILSNARRPSDEYRPNCKSC